MTDEQLLHHSYGKKPPRREKNKPYTVTLISMHVLRLLTCAQLHSDWSLHKKSIRMKQNCSWKVCEMPLLPLLKKENGKLKHHILPF